MPEIFTPSYIIGVDGGGTKCRLRLMDAAGNLLGSGVGGAANIRLGLRQAWGNILDAIDQALGQAGLDREIFPATTIGLGLAGVVNDLDVQRTIEEGPRFGKAAVCTDAHAACLGAFDGCDGGIVICGTGSASYAWIKGKGHVVGGWGFEVCDNGSSANLGREAIRAALRGHDDLLPATDFTRAVMARFGGTPANIVEWVDTALPRDYGELAPLVMDFAGRGDPVAVGIAEQTAHDLGIYIDKLRRLGAPKVCLLGGLSEPIRPWMAPWTDSVLASPLHDAVHGALIVASPAHQGEAQL